MNEKRYTIVRGQKKCPYYEVISKKCLLDLEDCTKECINIKGKFQYSDTKDQLIQKVAQVINDFVIPQKLINSFEKEMLLKNYDLHKKLARKIIEFMGVKDERKVSKNY